MITGNNIVQIQGRLTRDAEERMNGDMITFSLAVDFAGYEKGSDNNSGFFDCKVWMTENDYTAPGTTKQIRKVFTDNRLRKGSMVRVVGTLTQDRYTDKEGNKRSSVGITVESLESYARSDSNAGGADAAVVTQTAEAHTTVQAF